MCSSVNICMKITKVCTACHRELFLDSFRVQQGTKDGFQYECKFCMDARNRERYQLNPSILEQNKAWQRANKPKHNEANKKYYNSPLGRLNRGLNKALDGMLGKTRESLFHIIGTSVSALSKHLASTMPNNLKLEDYPEKWSVGFIVEPTQTDLKTQEGLRAVFHWKNLRVVEKKILSDDFGVNYADDK